MRLAAMSEILKPDVCVLGAGGVGTSLAIKARERGLSVVLVDQGSEEAGDPLLGTLHKAALLATAKQAQAIRTGARLGLDNALPKLNYKTIAEHAEVVAAAGAPQFSPERLAALGVQRLVGQPVFADRNTLSVGDSVLKPSHIILATGSAPAIPDLPGLAEIAYFTPDTILANVRKLTHLLVVGGDETAVELAQIYRRLGSDVTLVPQGPLLGFFDKEASAILRRLLREEGVAVLERASVKAFLPRSQGIGVSLDDPDGRVASLDISHVLIAGARVPQLNWAELEKARLRRSAEDSTRLYLTEHGLSSNSRVSAFGGAAGESNLHLALRKGERLLDRLAGRAGETIGSVGLPRLVATEPPVAQLGSAKALETPRAGARILRANLGENEAARASGQIEGMTKVAVGKSGTILGGVMVGQGAGEVIAALALAMVKGITARDLASLPITGTSPFGVLTDLGGQFTSQLPASSWSKRRASLRRLLP
jgi:pyruvate/2-oxoglutarate dehydrogenase complex dihydrolipoamide dehydrogenase (E3) component